ncbi:uncharacterized protein [Dermacentor albipictus]|uniref:uncharacterized protein n=1 Tax=Dermacentor albipictus TaxID=60249 RepID=UPI0031FDC8C4
MPARQTSLPTPSSPTGAMAASNSERNPATDCGDAACLRLTRSTTAGTGGLRPRTVRSRARTGGPTVAEMPPPRGRIPIPLLEEARPAAAMKLRERFQERVERVLLVALSCAVVLLVSALVSHIANWHTSVGTSMLTAGILIEIACWFLYLCSRHEKTRAQLAVFLFPEAERDAAGVAATESSARRSRPAPKDDDRERAGSAGDVGDSWYDNIV